MTNYLDRDTNYEKNPVIRVKELDIVSSYQNIEKNLKDKELLIFDYYIGVTALFTQNLLDTFSYDITINSDDIFYDIDKLDEIMALNLGEDRVRGIMFYGSYNDFIDSDKLENLRQVVRDNSDKKVLVYGVGASLLSDDGCKVFVDVTRWNIQLRYRDGLGNFKKNNFNEDILRKYKRGYFIEWRIADKHKVKHSEYFDYWIDANDELCPKMISKADYLNCLNSAVNTPFRLVPYFDPGVWGGQWMRKTCGLPQDTDNFAWSFDGVPEENSLLFSNKEDTIEFPAINLVLNRPKDLLGEKVYARFGAEFPIRFDFLDTFEGQNLSLQVHPTTEFIKKNYGMPYTQEESYYILDTQNEGEVYLGLKENVNKEDLFNDLEKAQISNTSFDSSKYVNQYIAKKHDHYLIPPGTIHCSGKDTMVLEISSSAYIFTFKLWDWDRVGLDGVPRPIHINEGKDVINMEVDTKFTEKYLINDFNVITKEDGYLLEKTGLYETEFIQTHRHSFSKPIKIEIDNNVRMCNLVEGEEIELFSKKDEFEPIIIHYVETFILPAHLTEVWMRPIGKSESKTVMVLEAQVK